MNKPVDVDKPFRLAVQATSPWQGQPCCGKIVLLPCCRRALRFLHSARRLRASVEMTWKGKAVKEAGDKRTLRFLHSARRLRASVEMTGKGKAAEEAGGKRTLRFLHSLHSVEMTEKSMVVMTGKMMFSNAFTASS